jgi:hypothetical protein
VRDFETGTRTPILNNREAIQGAFEAVGVRLAFKDDGSPLGIMVDAPDAAQ